MSDSNTYTIEVWIHDGNWEATEFAHHCADGLAVMGFRPVFFEDTGRTALLREVDE